ncbi:serine hydrolase [Flavobacterium aquidurense]|uniref:Beta-lactamase n=1 Tax=Flavobacterium aquidurense TaxID=362413 RepID=A0A0Q0WAH1_9FLAO|nr:serine hydrolase [Flavobacterium aquidurense]KQB41350.1 Beta-lactamase [Flavobacterium aquidurense]
MIHYKLYLFVVISFFSTISSFAQSDKTRQIDSLMQWSQKLGIFNGNVLVSKNDKIIYNKSIGFSDASKTIPLNTDYKFHIGSITKEFSALALAKLQEQGKLKLEDKVSKFIPEFPEWANDITIKNLLQYTSGLPNVVWKKIKNDKDLFDGLSQIENLDFKPGSDYDYNMNNVFLRQFIIERITGISFKSYVEEYLFKPCNMNSSIMTPFVNENNVAKGFNNDFINDPVELPLTGGTYLTAADLLKWEKCLYANKLITKQSLFEIGQSFDITDAQSGLGQASFKGTNLEFHLHDGRAGHFEAILLSDRKEKITIILLDNNHNGKVTEIAQTIRSILKNESYNLPKKSFFIHYEKQLNSLSSTEIINLYNSTKSDEKNLYDLDKADALNDIGQYLTDHDRFEDSIKIFNINMAKFSSSSILYSGLGDAYFGQGNLVSALLNYKKALNLDPKNNTAKKMIIKLDKTRQNN